MRKRVRSALWLLALVAGVAAAAERRLEGTVYYKGGEPAAEAAVEVEDLTTMQVISRRTDRDGHFRFLGLSPDKDYGVRATKKGYWSKTHTLSRFSSRPLETVTLYLVKRPGAH